jgi:hypothetical protein
MTRPSCALVAILLASLIGCATSRPQSGAATVAGATSATQPSCPQDIPYRDQRTVKLEPPARGARPADVLVRLQLIQGDGGGPGPTTARAATEPLPPPPKGGKVLASVETLATLGTPFYATTTEGESRIELGGVVTAARDATGATHYLVRHDFARRARLSMIQLRSNHLMTLGQTRTVGRLLPDIFLTLTLDRVMPPAATAPAR